ncbi:hypothetical protein COY16_02485 [Candidatus Roizmanbacteria bacterium CG_4_10_14_0_2_um_filter_39_13]|uniref:DUF2207 domain-containing protein n=1 Tax=Candidatus Roizmanbacteria bacterium CG_4_10_14_0_2_um_filter_39_13 TaxID=1974825 RepID=A0A2M7TZG5_9BACT|nr:MAG: hypothetical protein COY16_02485 [Candidatus Roizmanbacteria bacterium CG_4_10_14_0_2_um_filter_39_13]
MKRFFVITSWLILFGVLVVFPRISPIYASESITNFQQSTIINTDGTIEVTEKIAYDFGGNQKHGIFRTIPYTKLNQEGKKYKMALMNFSVVDESGSSYSFTETDESGEITLKIGDPDTTITGKHIYEIRYSVSGALTYFSDHDELYWNVTGNEWDVPIAHVQSSVQIPRSVIISNTTSLCYRGKKGSSDQCIAGKAGSNLIFEDSDLGTSSGMSIVIGFPKGHVAVLESTLITDFFETFLGRLFLMGIMIVGFLWYIAYPLWLPIKWWREGRDPKQVSTGVVSAWFDPPRLKADRPLGEKNNRLLSPAETGTLIDEQVNIKELAALIIHLAQRGYLKIVEKKKKEFDLIKQDMTGKSDELLAFEKHFLTKLFKDKTHVSLKKSSSFISLVTSTTDEIYEQTVKDGFFPEHPDKIRKKYTIIAGIAAFTFNIFLAISASVFGRIMPRKTLEGVHAANTARSLKNFLQSQERQLEFQADKQMMFEKLLPYAVSFGVEKIWAERFKDITLNEVDWYQSSTHDALTAGALTNSLNKSFAPSFQSAATPTTSSSGHSSGFSGGSSGGGGGGGGGGSW